MKKFFLCFGVLLCFLGTSSIAGADVIGGVDFPDGAISFADAVVSYNPGGGLGSCCNDPSAALGIPDFDVPLGSGAGGNGKYVSLGDEGSLVLQFTDNFLTTGVGDGDGNDLWIFEVGENLEPTDVYISQNGLDWISVGSTAGGAGGIDIDTYIGSGVTAGALYSYVKLVDLLPPQSVGFPWPGADIDAVGAISSASQPVPEPPVVFLFGLGLLGIAGMKRRKMLEA